MVIQERELLLSTMMYAPTSTEDETHRPWKKGPYGPNPLVRDAPMQ
jgi:hypothetical protein